MSQYRACYLKVGLKANVEPDPIDWLKSGCMAGNYAVGTGKGLSLAVGARRASWLGRASRSSLSCRIL